MKNKFLHSHIVYCKYFLLTSIMFLSAVYTVDAQRNRLSREAASEVKDTLYTFPPGEGYTLEVLFTRGPSHNHPLMAVWIEDMNHNYIQTLYIAESIGKGVFRYGDPSGGRWMPGPIRRPAALPYWGHQRGIRADDGYYLPTQEDPMPDAVTGPTPKAGFVLISHIPGKDIRQFRVLFEINQSWDWNEYWTNVKFPDDEHYMTSSQPALVYAAVIDLDSEKEEYELLPIGHSHWSGENGNLYEDLGTITTALDIAESIRVRIPR
ncbi:MAG: hypothetical protein EA394_07485 [Bacteroidia bacterium]|nr:MAG: hypothetical protein EA394_07485 [Bacteroidia bacterium]